MPLMLFGFHPVATRWQSGSEAIRIRFSFLFQQFGLQISDQHCWTNRILEFSNLEHPIITPDLN